MKFGRYIKNSSTPEWRSQFIDYKGLKKLIEQLKEQAAAVAATAQRQEQLRHPEQRQEAEQSTQKKNLLHRSSSIDGGGSIAENLSSFVLLEAGFTSAAAAARLLRQKFETALDKELNKVNSFYFKNERKFAEKQGMLNVQVQEMRHEVQRVVSSSSSASAAAKTAQQQVSVVSPSQSSESTSYNEALSRTSITVDRAAFTLPVKQRKLQSSPSPSSNDDSDTTSNKHLHHQRLHLHGVSTQLSQVVHRQYGKVSKKKHMKQLKAAFEEHYRSLVLLENYRITNYLGFVKIIKKFDKNLPPSVGEKKLAEEYLAKIETTPAAAGGQPPSFYTSSLLKSLITQTELLYTRDLFNNDRKAAMAKLRLPDKREQTEQNGDLVFSNASFRGGIWLGMCVFATIWWLFMFFTDWDRVPKTESMQSAFYLWRLILFPIVMALLIAVNMTIWDSVSINYVFIFEFDARRFISKAQYFEVCLLLLLAWLLSSLVFMYLCVLNNLYWGGSPDVSNWFIAIPVVFYVVMFIFLVNPFNFAYRRSRYWLLGTLLRSACAPFFSVKFKDFFLANQLTSLSEFLFGVQFVMCYATSSLNPSWSEFCTHTISIGIPLLNAWPIYSRFAQCLRRYFDSRQKHPHLTNALKYFLYLLSTILAFLALVISGKDPWSWIRIIWIVETMISTTFQMTWDFGRDWGLLKFGAKVQYPLLREKLTYRWYWYYLAIVQNLVLRYLWFLVYLLKQFYPGYMSNDAISFVIVLSSLFRRFVWNIFRMEMENLSNLGKFRAVQDVPLPYASREFSTSKDKDHGFNLKIIEKDLRRVFCFLCLKSKRKASKDSVVAKEAAIEMQEQPAQVKGVRFAEPMKSLELEIPEEFQDYFGSVPDHLAIRIVDTLTDDGFDSTTGTTTQGQQELPVPSTPSRTNTSLKGIFKKIKSAANLVDEAEDEENHVKVDASVTYIDDDDVNLDESEEDEEAGSSKDGIAMVRPDQIDKFLKMSMRFKSNMRTASEIDDASAEAAGEPEAAAQAAPVLEESPAVKEDEEESADLDKIAIDIDNVRMIEEG